MYALQYTMISGEYMFLINSSATTHNLPYFKAFTVQKNDPTFF